MSCYFYFVLYCLLALRVLLYSCDVCVALFIDMFVLCVACLTVSVNNYCLGKQLAICLDVVIIAG